MSSPPKIPADRDPDVASVLELLASSPDPAAGLEVPEPEVEPPVRGERLLRWLERGFLRLDQWVGLALPEAFNPFLHTGAIAVTTLLVATATGILLLVWYSPSVHNAYASVEAMAGSPWTAELTRSLHRYSSDACMFFALVHALRLFLARRFGGARWLAWITGIGALAVLWFVGWTGYWLVWDVRAQHVALGTARVLDAVPIFADPMARSFVTDEGVNSLLFFVVFFFHMLVPLAMAVLLWLHITRLSRPQFLTGSVMTLWVLGSLVAMSLVYPADLAAPARMTALAGGFDMDWWYLAPLAVTDRLGGGAIWSAVLAGGVLLVSVPWTLGRGRARTASVTVRRCNACQKCYQDCPYAAISMVPRTDGSTRHSLQASVDPNRCVGCGICAGSCDTAGVGLEWFSVGDQRRRLAVWLKRAADAGEKLHVAFLCGQAAGGGLSVDPATGTCPELPGYLVLTVPCAGWLHPFGIEHSLRFGGQGVLVVACGSCRYREGARWERLRLEGRREPALRTEKVDRERVRLLFLDRTRRDELFREARRFREGGAAKRGRGAPGRGLASLAAALLAALLAGVVGLASDLGYAAPRPPGSELVVTFRHPGQVTENCRELSPEELARLPVHMRKPRVCDRARSPVRLRVEIDGRSMVDSVHPPSGIWGDGSSVALERLSVDVGEHAVTVRIADGPDPEEWQYVDEATLHFSGEARRVLVFDRASGFTWH